jgi:hypothetical protein
LVLVKPPQVALQARRARALKAYLGAGQAAAGGILGAAQARASGYMGAQNTLMGGIGGAYSLYQQQQLLNQLARPTTSPFSFIV